MNNSIVNVPEPINEPIKDYKPNSTEKDSVLATYKNLKDSTTDVKMWIGGNFVDSSKTSNMHLCYKQMLLVGTAWYLRLLV